MMKEKMMIAHFYKILFSLKRCYGVAMRYQGVAMVTGLQADVMMMEKKMMIAHFIKLYRH
jgi:hypothetical protein